MIVIEILVEMLKALALATRMMNQNRISRAIRNIRRMFNLFSSAEHFVQELFRGDDMKAIVDRLHKLTTVESRMTVVEILGMVNQGYAHTSESPEG